MQKLINVLALASFAVSTAIVAGGTYVYLNKDAMIESAKQAATKAATKAATEAVTSALPGLLDAAMPELPEVTGGAVPTGGGLPGF